MVAGLWRLPDRKPLDFGADERWHVAMVKGNAALDERREPLARVTAFEPEIRKLKQFRVRLPLPVSAD
jgi:hypothetical protein